MIMNERIQELITAYLHRGSTPEQERELFDACKNHPQVAEHLRQHLILSLKLRRLREDVTVDETLHSAVSERIASLAGGTAAQPTDADAEVGKEIADGRETKAPGAPPRFGFRHVFGSAFVAAAAAVLFFFLLPEDTDSPAVQRADFPRMTDTVIVVERDTVLQVREVSYPVYIVEKEQVPDGSEPPATADGSGSDIESDAVSESLVRNPQEAALPSTDGITENSRLHAHDGNPERRIQDDTPERSPLYADAIDPEQRHTSEKARSYIEQYNAMLVSVESVQLTSQDRIAY